MKFSRSIAPFIFVSVFGFCMCPSNADQEPAADEEAAAAEIEQQRQTVLQSVRWVKARSQFKKWLSVQTAYTDEQVEALEREMHKQIDAMTGEQLQEFLKQMEAKLAVLLSPAVADARRWADKYYTEAAQKRMIKKYGVEDPLSLSADEMAAAISGFYAARQSKVEGKATFDRATQSQNEAARRYASDQQKARAQAAQQSRSSPVKSSTAYAPRKNSRPQTYSAPYPKSNYSIGPWGGVWMHR